MKKKLKILILFLIITFLIFRQVFINNEIPFSSNLLVSFYQPWFSQYGNSVPNKPLGADDLRIFYPLRLFTQESLKNFALPFWNPYIFSGNVHLANSQSAVFYPLNIIYFLFSPINAWTILVIAGVFLLFVFTYLFSLQLLKDKTSAFFVSLAFSFSGPMLVRIEDGIVIYHTFLWLPLILLGIELYLKNKKPKYLLLSTFGLCSSILAGWFQFSFYVLFISFLYSLIRLLSDRTTLKKKAKHVILIASFFILSLSLTAFHLFPALEALKYSPRGGSQPVEFTRDFLLNKEDLITFLVPDFFGNPGVYNYWGRSFYKETVLFIPIIALFFAIFEALSHFLLKERDKLALFFIFLSVICFVFGFKTPISLFIASHNIPIISSFIPSRVFAVSAFSLSMLSGFGLKRWLTTKGRKNNILLLITMLLFAFSFLFIWRFLQDQKNIYSPINWRIAFRNMIIPFFSLLFVVMTIFLKGFIKSLKKGLARSIFPGLLVFGLCSFGLYFCNKYLYFSKREYVFPQHPVIEWLRGQTSDHYRFWSYGNGYITSNFSAVFKIYSPEGVDAMYPVWYARLFSACGTKGEYPQDLSRIEAKACFADEKNQGWDNFYQKRLLDILSVKYIVGLKEDNDRNKQTLEKNIGPKLWQNDKWEIFENKNVLPRAFLAYNYEVESNDKQMLKTVYAEDFEPLKTVILADGIDIKKTNEKIQALKINQYSGNKVVIEASSNDEAILFLSDTYYPGWKASIDGEKTDVIRANYAFRAIKFPKGSHRVVFQYSPESFKIGFAISLISGILFFLFIKKMVLWLG